MCCKQRRNERYSPRGLVGKVLGGFKVVLIRKSEQVLVGSKWSSSMDFHLEDLDLESYVILNHMDCGS